MSATFGVAGGGRRRWSLALLVALVMVGACERRPRQPWLRPGDVPLRDTRSTGQLDSRGLMEGSGIVTSDVTPGLLWALNDSGNDPDLFALDTAGHVRGVVRVTGARNRDWEALAHGPCPVGQCLYVGDVGDNSGRRDEVQVYWLPQPEAPSGVSEQAAAGVIHVRFADGAHDVEAMYVAPDTSLWFVTKRPSLRPDGTPRPSHVHVLPRGAWNDPTPLAVLDSVPVVPQPGRGRDWVTDASLSPPDASGRVRLALLTYGAIYVLEADAVTGRPGTLVARCALPIAETTAEGLTWLADGRLLILSEGRGARLHAGRCP